MWALKYADGTELLLIKSVPEGFVLSYTFSGYSRCPECGRAGFSDLSLLAWQRLH